MSAKEQDQSMEEILQSIKRIIADEGEASPGGSDVLELTDVVEPPAAPIETPEPTPEPVAAEAPAEPEPVEEELSIDDIMAMPTEPASAPVEPVPEPATMEFSNEGLVSNATVASSASALKNLMDTPAADAVAPSIAPIQFRSGVTVEDLVVEALKPMLKEWLDDNLPQLVEKLVDREIKRIVALTR